MSELLLLSGGIDSVALAVWRMPALCLTVDYGQCAAEAEIQASTQVCTMLGLRHQVIRLDLRALGSGCMAGERRSPHSTHDEFWPFRNQLLITLGAMTAMKSSCTRVLIGTVATDSRHLDGSSCFIKQMRELVAHQEGGIEVLAPGIELTSAQMVRAANVDPAVLGWAHSCHVGKIACGKCPGCHKHSEVMSALGWFR